MKLLQQLWDLADREAQKKGRSRDYAFDGIGLRLDRPISTWEGYSSTPTNSSTFASTGGDGVHFGLLHVENKIAYNSPVVMTVPMMFDKPNVIVGENLLEFLCLGCEIGYFVLERLAYGFGERNIQDWFHNNQNQIDDKEKELLQILKTEFDLTSWTNIEARLDELDKHYLPLLQLKEVD